MAVLQALKLCSRTARHPRARFRRRRSHPLSSNLSISRKAGAHPRQMRVFRNTVKKNVESQPAQVKPTERIAYSPITERPPLTLPGGARMVVWVIVNVEEWDINQ